jgi:hypothetical protein
VHYIQRPERRGRNMARGVLHPMRLTLLVLTAALIAAPARAQQPPASAPLDNTSGQTAPREDTDGKSEVRSQKSEVRSQKVESGSQHADAGNGLPVSIEKIKEALQQPPSPFSLRTLDERPTFRVQIQERMKIEELLASLNFKTAPAPGGGLYGYEQQRQMFPAVDNPLRQPYAAFNQGELLTILIENLAMKYLGGRAMNAISNAERARAEAAAKEEVRDAVAQYCTAQPRQGAGIQICDTTVR